MAGIQVRVRIGVRGEVRVTVSVRVMVEAMARLWTHGRVRHNKA